MISLNSTSLAEDYCVVKSTFNNLIHAAAVVGDCKTILEAVNINKALELDQEQIQKIIDSR